ncbi:uncharacterized protein TrAFT101_006875 [Trichoderma asperellum]|uniref:uncharacterized protein n=1 Tax=Trichoderma asperellum TaxID=101201 RepID=UPI0033306D05|nr:hypothetical protein TrAFT101_006875 [Trichoderma asperellum]
MAPCRCIDENIRAMPLFHSSLTIVSPSLSLPPLLSFATTRSFVGFDGGSVSLAADP